MVLVDRGVVEVGDLQDDREPEDEAPARHVGVGPGVDELLGLVSRERGERAPAVREPGRLLERGEEPRVVDGAIPVERRQEPLDAGDRLVARSGEDAARREDRLREREERAPRRGLEPPGLLVRFRHAPSRSWAPGSLLHASRSRSRRGARPASCGGGCSAGAAAGGASRSGGSPSPRSSSRRRR